MNERYPIPAKLNLLISAVQLTLLISCFYLAGLCQSWPSILAVAVLYGAVMNSSYAMLHEAEHGILHPNPTVNHGVGVVLAFFFPAPYHLIRQGHLGHHMRNRSDDEAFDFYFEGESPAWKYLQFYGILTGMFWVVLYLTNFLALFAPHVLAVRKGWFDRPTEALMETLNGRYLNLIRLEALAIVALHGGLIALFGIPWVNYFVMLFGFGFSWSSLQYVHHYRTERDVLKGARNLETFPLMDLLWLNHNWHQNHHRKPTVPWLYLPELFEGEETPRESMLSAYLRQWAGPRYTSERVENRYRGKIIK